MTTSIRLRTLVSIIGGAVMTLLLTIFVSGCVSLKIGLSGPEKSTDMNFKNPPSNFVKLKAPDVDDSWTEKHNGNTISVLSECHDKPDPSLAQIQEGVMSEIEDASPLETEQITFNNRDAIHSIVDGTVDGVATRFELVIFKKSDCTYILTYAGVAKSFGDNQRDFERFVKGFRVP